MGVGLAAVVSIVLFFVGWASYAIARSNSTLCGLISSVVGSLGFGISAIAMGTYFLYTSRRRVNLTNVNHTPPQSEENVNVQVLPDRRRLTVSVTARPSLARLLAKLEMKMQEQTNTIECANW